MFWKHSKNESKSLLVATLLLFSAYAVFISSAWHNFSTQELAITANSVGVYAGVESNEVNTLLAQLDERERVLEARENAILNTATPFNNSTLLFMTLLGFGLFGLILTNFYLDSKRRLNLAT